MARRESPNCGSFLPQLMHSRRHVHQVPRRFDAGFRLDRRAACEVEAAGHRAADRSLTL